ncbi:12842_t:CDS:2, partial [Cetraspora pellucida]
GLGVTRPAPFMLHHLNPFQIASFLLYNRSPIPQPSIGSLDSDLQFRFPWGGSSLEDTKPNGHRFAGPWSFFPFIQTLYESLGPGIERLLPPS